MELDQVFKEKQRRQCWIDAWCAVASAFNCKEPKDATKWADAALKAYDERFNKPEPNGN